jgi:hypothetical protein
LPIQLSFAASKRMPGSCSVWSIAELCMIVGGAVLGRNPARPRGRAARPRAASERASSPRVACACPRARIAP